MHLNNVGSLWLRRYAVLVAFCTFGLVIAGGLVTSNYAALSVPDWPLSWGHLVPTLEGGIRYEFAHRVAAMLVGLLTVGLAVWMQASAKAVDPDELVGRTPWSARDALVPPPEVRQQAHGGVGRGPGGPPHPTRLAWAAVAVVLAQAALGGIAVRFVIPAWATIAHAALGQLFFAIMVAICVRLYASVDGACAAPTLLCTVALFAQTILGAGVRYGVVAGVVHITGAVLATAVVMWAALSILMQIGRASCRDRV